MKFLIDTSKATLQKKLNGFSDLVGGQLLTPLTRYSNAGGVFAIDNGAYSGFNDRAFASLLKREEGNRSNCIFVTCVDIVGNARRTLELWKYRHNFLHGWPKAFVVQDGMEDLEIPWGELSAVFIGGNDPWKDSKAAQDIARTSIVLGIHCHVGRVNTLKRFKLYAEIGANTCDGSGVAMYDHMLEDIAKGLSKKPEPSLFDNKEQHG
jgi:hypothetical protein